MISWYAMAVISLALASPEAVFPDGGDTATAASAWMTDYAAAKTAARQTNRPIMVVFR